MKTTFNYNNIRFAMLCMGVLAFGILSSCQDDGASGGMSMPVIEKVYQLDTVSSHKDSTFNAAEPDVLLVINGQNIGGVIYAYFNEYETSFNTNYNTDTDLIIRVPPEAPTDSTASNLIRLVTSHGEATFQFKIIAKATITSVDKHVYGADRGDFTFKGKNFADMITVIGYREKDSPTDIVKDSVICEIISKSPEKIVIRIPENTLSRLTLKFTNTSGTTVVGDTFINADEADIILAEDFGTISSPDGEGKWSGDSWGNPFTITSDQAYSGSKSFSILLSPGGWSWFGVTSWWPRYYYDTDYKYVTFAIKGGEDTIPLWITSGATKAGFGEYPDVNKFEVTAKVWNYYKIAIKDLDFMYEGSIISQMGFRPQGPDKAELLYVDDFMFVK